MFNASSNYLDNFLHQITGGNRVLVLKLSLVVPALLASIGNHLNMNSHGEQEQLFAIQSGESALK